MPTKPKKVLFLTIHRPDRTPSQRFRFEQYLEHLTANGFECEVSYLIREQDDNVFYSSGNYLKKCAILARSILKRLGELWRAQQYAVVFVQREGFMLGTAFFERGMAKRTKMIFDFDDSIWLQGVSAGNRRLGFLKDSSKTAKLIQMSDLIFAGNPVLAEYAMQFNRNVCIIPTTIDTDKYQRTALSTSDRVCVGWSGSFSTIDHFTSCLPALQLIKARFGERVYFKVIGDGNYRNEDLGIQGVEWSREDELEELSEIDIGLMPLPDTEWTKGKCGLKGLQYMALGIPAIMSPVGVNTEIIQDGVNGFLAKDRDEWVRKISLLVDDPQLRRKLGDRGRETVIERYSVIAFRDQYVRRFKELTSVT